MAKTPRGLDRGPETNDKLNFGMTWTHGLTEEEKRHFIEALRIQMSGPVFEKLRKMIEDQVESINRKQGIEQDYTSPSWAYHQAHMIGSRQALLTVLKMITPTGLER